MVLAIVLALVAVLIVVIALYSVGHAVGATEKMPDQIVIDVHEAIEFCAEALPEDVTAVLSYDELRRLLRLHLEWIQAYHWAPEDTGPAPIVFEQFDALDYVMERVQVTDLEVSRDHAASVIQAHSDYLQVMGAIHLDDPVDVERDLAELPLLDSPRTEELEEGDLLNKTGFDDQSGADHKPATEHPTNPDSANPDPAGSGNE